MFNYLKSYASLLDKLFVDSMSYSFVDFKKKLTKTQHAIGKAAVKTFKAEVAFRPKGWGGQEKGKGRCHFTKGRKKSVILGRKWYSNHCNDGARSPLSVSPTPWLLWLPNGKGHWFKKDQ